RRESVAILITTYNGSDARTYGNATITAVEIEISCDSSAKFFVGGNWKANGTLASIMRLCQDLNQGASTFKTKDVDVIVSPTMVHLGKVRSLLDTHYQVASQNVALKGLGAYTGEVPAEILHDLGVDWAITGHSERRAMCGETNEVVGMKTGRAVEQGLSVIACIGETLDQRKSGKLFEVLDAQVQALVDHVKDWSKVVIAYEPVWAIGTGVVASPAQAQEVHSYLRRLFAEKLGSDVSSTLRLIYGGSVTDQNCSELASQADIDGFLVGGASLKGPSFLNIIRSHSAKSVARW
ncbi:uncharacterized protein HaLaN_09288, partial [Haematococcus lacustris]